MQHQDERESSPTLATQKPVCVTGASGFIAAHIIAQLLQKGYSVRGTVRSTKDAREKYAYLYALDPTDGDKLELVEADLLNEGSFDSAVDGCEMVMHTASPFILTVSDPQRDLVDPAVQGTLNVLRACSKAGTIKRVVLTSSVAAITDEPRNDHVYTEADWNEESSLNRNAYHYSKKLAEETAWNYNKEHPEDFKLVVINPFMVIGPHIGNGTNPSTDFIRDILNGQFPGIINIAWGMVDVRDVAKAHVLAMEKEEAEGRYICCNETLWMKDMVQVMREGDYGDYALPKRDLSCKPGSFLVRVGSYFQGKGMGQALRHNMDRFPRLDNSKIKRDLGMEFVPIRDSLLDTCEDLVRKGQVQRKEESG